jgi:hypothetical protein
LSYFVSVTLPAVGLSGGRYAVSVRFALFFYHTITTTRFLKTVKVHRTDSMVVKRPFQAFSRKAAADFPEYDIILFLVLK